MIKDVKYPSREEIEEHNKTHSPFQEWCRYCVRGRATNSQHKSKIPEDELSTIPSISMDYGFMCKADEEKQLNLIGLTHEPVVHRN